MGCECYYEGDVPLKAGVTFEQVAELYLKHRGCGDEEPELDEWKQWQPEDEVTFTWEDGELNYSVDGYFTIHFPSEFDDFLEELADTYASDAWMSVEGTDREEVPRGPDPLTVARMKVRYAEASLVQAQQDLERYQQEVEKLMR